MNPRHVTEQPLRLCIRLEGLELAECRCERHGRKTLRHQFAARARHHGIGGSDDAMLGTAERRLQRQPARLRHVARVDIASQIPFAYVRVCLPPREHPIFIRLDDVGDA